MSVKDREGFHLFVNAAFTLGTKKVPEDRRAVYASIVAENSPSGIYRSEEEKRKIISVGANDPSHEISLKVPWSIGDVFEPYETLASIVQFHDETPKPLPSYAFPKEEIEEYTQRVLGLSENPSLDLQYKIALEIADNNRVAVLYLLAIASRANCRGLDNNKDGSFRDRHKILQWYQKTNIFDFLKKSKDSNSKVDWAGNLYYFWTHSFGKLYLAKAYEAGFFEAKLLDEVLLGKGTSIMKLARGILVMQPQMSNYNESSAFGRRVGQELVDTFKYKSPLSR